ncbi:hypothetical protein LZT27_14305 [Aeromonas veronii]|uniref:defense against restriction DarA-related protein n=1 Tax=Aeromonas veronii TaxID=654 RepID=UPI0023633947|nr:hypothetical protein [Aeromonas veronii]MDD1845764.1 hypothetical protein [Aeromonas veronii]
MNPIYFMSRAINVLDVIDHTTKPLTTEAYLDALGDDGMMLEAVTLEEVEATYLYGLDTDERMMLEAITTTKNRIEKTMAAFVRSLNQQLNSSGMEAYQAEIGKPAKSGQVAVMTARIPLSDGQSISVVFHSPSGDPGKIVANDDLVAFRFLLNKRDVTHVVAPSGGQDISLKQTCLTLSNLAERNSAKFQSKQAETKAKEAELATLQASTEQLQAEAADVIEKADQLTERAAADSQKEAEIKAKLDKQVARNEELRRQLAGMGGEPAPSQTAKTNPEPEQGSAPEGGAEPSPESAVPAEPEKTAMPTDTIRKVNQELNMDGESTLSNGAKISKVLRDEDGSLEGYITLTEPGGKSYVLKSPSSQGGAMGDTAKKLYKAYREGKAEKYLGTVPGAGMSEKEAEGLLEAMAFGTKTLNDYADMSAPSEVVAAQMLALTRLYGEMDAAISAHDPDWAFGKTTRERLLGHYLQIDDATAHEIANNLTRRKMPNGDQINVASPSFGAEKLVRGEYTSSEILSRLLELGGTYSGAPKDEQIKYAKRQRAWAEQAKANAQESYDKAKEQGVEAAFEAALNKAASKLEAFDRYLATLGAASAGDSASVEPATDPSLQQDPDSIPTEPVTAPLYWFGLKSRPLSNGAQPAGHADYIAPEDARLASVAAGRPATDTRWGAVAYAEPLSDELVAQYELVDLSSTPAFVWNEQTRASKFAELSNLTNAMLQDGDGSVEIWQQVMTPNSPQVEKNPFYVDGKYETTEVTKAFQEAGYTGTVKNMFNQFIDQQLDAIEQANKSPEDLEEERKAKAKQGGLAALNALKKGARVPAGWAISIDDDFGDYGSIEVDTPELPNGEEHDGYLVTANANDAGELDGTFNLTTGNGDPISDGHTKWPEISKAMQADYQKDEAAAQPPVSDPAPAVDPAPTEPTDGATPAENQWGETDPDVLALLQQAEELRTTETNPERYLAELQRIGGELDQAGAVERHEPYLHTVSDRLTELMEAEGV